MKQGVLNLQAIAEQSRIVRLPLNKIGAINKINKTFSKLEQEFEREPSADELATMLDLTEEDVRETMKNNSRHISMDAPLGSSEDAGSMLDLIASDDLPSPMYELMGESLRLEIERALKTLTVREADVVKFFFGLNGKYPLTLEEIGEKFELTRERVRQIKEKAVRRLKHTSRSKILKTYLG
jgi:RNA polymerase primary sigma factor